MIAKCVKCGFKVPCDEFGIAIMREHLKEHKKVECDLCEGTGKAIWPEYFGEDPNDIPECSKCNGRRTL